MICKSIYILRVTHYTIYWDKTQTLKKFPSDKIKVTKNALFFLLQFPTHHRFNFNSQFLYKLKQKFHLCKNVSGIFSCPFCFVFIKVYIFFQQKSIDALTLKRHISFQNKNNRKAKHRFTPAPLIFKLQQEVWKLNDICVSCSYPKSIMEAKLWVRCIFSIGICK